MAEASFRLAHTMPLSTQSLSICIKSMDRGSNDRFHSRGIIEKYFPNNPVILFVSNGDEHSAANYRKWIKTEELPWTVYETPRGIRNADYAMFMGDTGLKMNEFFIQMNDDVTSIEIVSSDAVAKTAKGNEKQLVREITMGELHSAWQPALEAASKFGGCLIGFPTTNARFPSTKMVPATGFKFILDTLCIVRRGPTLVYDTAMQMKSDMAKTCLAYEAAGWVCRIDLIKVTAGYDSSNPPGGLTGVADRLQQQIKAEQALLTRFGDYISKVSVNKKGNRAFTYKRNIRQPRVIFLNGEFQLRETWDNTDSDKDDNDLVSDLGLVKDFLDTWIASIRCAPDHVLMQGKTVPAQRLIRHIGRKLEMEKLDAKRLGILLKEKFAWRRVSTGVEYFLEKSDVSNSPSAKLSSAESSRKRKRGSKFH